MRLTLTCIGILLFSLCFELLAPNPPELSEADYGNVQLTDEEINSALLQAKRTKILDEIGYFKTFPYYPIKLYPDTYFWMIIARIIDFWYIGVIIWLSVKLSKYEPYSDLADYVPFVFLLVQQLGDMIDWGLTYNTKYMSLYGLPVSYNTLSFICYLVLIIIYHLYRDHGGSKTMRLYSDHCGIGGSYNRY